MIQLYLPGGRDAGENGEPFRAKKVAPHRSASAWAHWAELQRALEPAPGSQPQQLQQQRQRHGCGGYWNGHDCLKSSLWHCRWYN